MIQKEFQKSVDKATELFEENTKLKKQVKIYQDRESADINIKDVYEQMKKENAELKEK